LKIDHMGIFQRWELTMSILQHSLNHWHMVNMLGKPLR